MTATSPSDVSIGTLLRRAAAAEWTRLWTLRSTWWALLAGTAVMLLMGVAFGVDFSGEATPVWLAAEFAIVPGQLAFLLVITLAVTVEYSTGMIRTSLQWVPRRGVELTARTLVTVGFAAVAAVVVSLVTDVVAWALIGGDAQVVAGDVARSLGMIALLVTTGGLLTVGLGILLRSTAGTLTSVFMLVLGLPMLLPTFQVAWLTWAAERLPGYASAALLEALELDLATTTVAAVLITWSVAPTVAGAWSLLQRDAG